MSEQRRVVIVGASAAGFATAEALRRYGFAGELAIVGDEPALATDRPPLSKQVLLGTWDAERAALVPPDRVEKVAARFLVGTRATRLDMDDREVHLDTGGRLPYDEVVIATGVRPRTLPQSELAGVHTLRTYDDAIALRRDLVRSGRLLVVGAGFLGLEVAATARTLDVAVTVVEPLEAPLVTRLGAIAATRLLDQQAAHGVDVRCGVGVARLLADNGVVRGAELSDGSVVESDVVLIAVGCTPNVEWLAESGVPLADGVLCDAHCQAALGVWAAGDVARWHHAGLGHDLRIEHRMNATEQGTAVARNLVGDRQAFMPVPFFWTDQFDVKVQLAGVVPRDAEERIEFGDPDGASFVVGFHRDGRLVGALGWNAAKAMMPLRRELVFDAVLT